MDAHRLCLGEVGSFVFTRPGQGPDLSCVDRRWVVDDKREVPNRRLPMRDRQRIDDLDPRRDDFPRGGTPLDSPHKIPPRKRGDG